MHEKLTDIWNSLWIAYKNFLKSGSVTEWTKETHEIIEKYSDDEMIMNFAENIAISWLPIIGNIKGSLMRGEN